MRIVINPAYHNTEAFIKTLPSVFDNQGVMVYEKRNTIKMFDVDGLQLVVKRFKRPNLVQRIAYTWFRPSKAKRAYLFAERFRRSDIATPHEVAYLECTKWGLFSDSYFVSVSCSLPSAKDLLADDARLEDASGRGRFQSRPFGPYNREALLEAIGSFIATVHSRGILHGDLNISNILCRETGATGAGPDRETDAWHFVLIDTNRAKFRQPTQSECVDDLKRVSHDRDILLSIVGYYAMARGWDEEWCRAAVLRKLCAFERRKECKRRLRWLFHCC